MSYYLNAQALMIITVYLNMLSSHTIMSLETFKTVLDFIKQLRAKALLNAFFHFYDDLESFVVVTFYTIQIWVEISYW